MFKMSSHASRGPIRMLIFDMAGTVINEEGIVYKTLYNTMMDYRLDVNKEDMYKWHGRNKYEVLTEYLKKDNSLKLHESFTILEEGLHDSFDYNLKERYFSSSNSIKLMDEKIPELFNKIRERNIKIALNTGYGKDIQEAIIKKLNMTEFVDDYISSEEVKYGRPYPYMIYRLMEEHGIDMPTKVVKFGDTQNDIMEGKNAGCWSVGVLSGSDGADRLIGADAIINSVMNITMES